MRRNALISLVAGCALVAALVVAGCGGSATASQQSSGGGASRSSGNSSGGYGYGGGGGSVGSPAPAKATAAATIAVRTTSLGRILVDGRGMTLYLFEKDTGTSSTCYGSCAQFWPPVTTQAAPKAGAGVDAAKLGTTTRDDGTKQVTYNGHPLYLYSGDAGPGATNGEGVDTFGALWYVLSPGGNAITR